MYKSVWEFKRSSRHINFPPGNAKLSALRSIAPGFIGLDISFDDDGLTKRVQTSWESEDDALNFLNSNAEVIITANYELMEYCEIHRIQATRTVL